MERWQQYFYESLNSMDGMEIRKKVIQVYQEPQQQTEPPTNIGAWEIIMETKHFGKKFIQ